MADVFAPVRDAIAIHRAPVIGRLRLVNAALYLLHAGFWLVRNRRRYDIVHCQQMSGAALVGLLARRITSAPVLIKRRRLPTTPGLISTGSDCQSPSVRR